MRRLGLFLLVLAVHPISDLGAQLAPPPKQAPRSMRDRGQPIPIRKSFQLTEVCCLSGLAVPANYDRHYPTWELDLMANTDQNTALGGTFYGRVRLGSKPGLYGAVAEALAFAAVVVVFLITCSGGGCWD